MLKPEFIEVYEKETGSSITDSPLSAKLLESASPGFYSHISILCDRNPHCMTKVFDILTVIETLREQEVIDKADRRNQTKSKYNEIRKIRRLVAKTPLDPLPDKNLDKLIKVLTDVLPPDVAVEKAREYFKKDAPSISMDLSPLLLKPITSDQSGSNKKNRPTKANVYFNRAIYEVFVTAESSTAEKTTNWLCDYIAKVLESLSIVKTNNSNFDRQGINDIVKKYQ